MDQTQILINNIAGLLNKYGADILYVTGAWYIFVGVIFIFTFVLVFYNMFKIFSNVDRNFRNFDRNNKW